MRYRLVLFSRSFSENRDFKAQGAYLVACTGQNLRTIEELAPESILPRWIITP